MSGSCPICQRSETHVTADSGQEMNRTECCVCGRFRIPNESPMAVATALQTPMDKAKLTRMIHKENDAGRVPILTTEVVEEALRMTLPQKQAMAISFATPKQPAWCTSHWMTRHGDMAA